MCCGDLAVRSALLNGQRMVLDEELFSREDGNFGLMSGILVPVLFGAAALAVDYTTLSNARADLQNHVDAAVLAVSNRTNEGDEKTEIYKDFLEAELSANENYTLVTQSLKQVNGVDFLRTDATATVKVPLVFLGKFMPNTVSVAASTVLSTLNIEIAIALDNTGSMGSGGIQALKDASHALIDTLEEIDTSSGQTLKVGLVPFVTSVNVKGEGFKSNWIDEKGESLYNGWTFLTDGQRSTRKSKGGNDKDFGSNGYPHHFNLFDWTETTWKGCVEARPAPYNTDLTAPNSSNPNTLFVPYFAPDEPGDPLTKGGNSSSAFNNSWLDDVVGGSHEQKQRSIAKYKTQKPVVANFKDTTGPLTLGPNRACPTPIVPLTETMSKVRTGINAMQYWNGSGTNIAEGVAWGWRLLSPAEPYSQALPFGDSARKILVVMTDGTNVSFGASNTINKSDYGSYGFLTDERIPSVTTKSTAEAYINDSVEDMCVDIKKLDVEIYTIIYKTTNTQIVDLFSGCASKSANFFMAKDVDALKEAFASIGQSVAGVRLTN